MKNKIYYKSLFYVFLMVIYGILTYVFLWVGFNTKTKIRVDYQDVSDVYYDVKYIDDNYKNVNSSRYVSNMVKYIDMKYIYNNVISEYVSGYYKYSVDGYLIAYEDDINNSLWEREYKLADEKTFIIDENNINNIKIEDGFRIDFKKYRDEINKFINNYDIDVEGYLHVRINVSEFLNFNNLNNEYADSKVITVNIPITSDTFKIDVKNIDDVDSYYEFSKKESMNIIFLIIGAFCFAFSISSFVMVIKHFGYIYNRQSKFRKCLNKILSKYDECIVRVNKLYVSKKYNMIYVSSFDEFMDVYYKKNKMISFKEVKRDSEALFVIIDNDDAWIYRMDIDNLE